MKSLRVDLPVPVCSESVSDYAAASSSAGASSDPTAASRVPVSAAPASVGPGSSGQPQAEPSCSPASLYQPSHVRLAPLRPEKQASREPSTVVEGGSNSSADEGFWSQTTDETVSMFDSAYREVISWRRNVFMVPFGSEGKEFVKEIARLIGLFTDGSGARAFAWSAVVVACHLLLQKPFRGSAASDHKTFLAKRLGLWTAGDLSPLLRESRCIQAHLSDAAVGDSSPRPLDDVRLANMVFNDRVGSAAQYLDADGAGGVLPLDEEVSGKSVLEHLRDKHPAPQPADPDILLDCSPDPPDPVMFEAITPAAMKKTILGMKGAAGPSALDAAAWRRMVGMFKSASDELCSALSRVAKCLCTERLDALHLRPFLAARLIPLDKRPGVRPIAVGEVFRRAVGKAIMAAIEKDVVIATAPTQLCVGIPSACEVAVEALSSVFAKEESEAILLVDATNAFNSVNRAAALNNIPRVCPAAGRVFVNTYQADIPLYLDGGETLYSREGTCQGDPLAMAFYALATVPLAKHLSTTCSSSMQVWYADDDAAVDRVVALGEYWNCISAEGPKYGYKPNAAKTVLLVKSHLVSDAERVFAGTGIRICSDGVRYLGGVIGSTEFCDGFVGSRVGDWCALTKRLASVAETQPHAAYHLFISAIQSRWSYLQRVANADGALYAPLDRVLNDQLLPAFTGHSVPVEGGLRALLSLPAKLGGLAVRSNVSRAAAERTLCRDAIAPMVELVVGGTSTHEVSSVVTACRTLAAGARAARRVQQRNLAEEIRSGLPPTQRLLVEVAGEDGVSSWLTTPPATTMPGTVFSRTDFRDAVGLRYGLPLEGLPASCVCGKDMTSHHAMTCPCGGYPTQRHNEVRDLLAGAMSEVAYDVELEPVLLPLDGETVSGIRADAARADIRARGFWTRQQNAFFDVRVTHPRPSLLSRSGVASQLSDNERQKKRQYSSRINNVDRGSFTPLVFATNGQCAPEASIFLKSLAAQISERNRDLPYSLIMRQLRARISVCLIRWQITCLRGSRHSYRRRLMGAGHGGFVAECRARAHLAV